MNRTKTLLSLSCLSILLSACSFGSLLGGGKNYAGYEEYLTQELKMTKYLDLASLNQAIASTAYQWKDGGTSEKYGSHAYYTAHNDMVFLYEAGDKFSFNTTDGENLYLTSSGNGYIGTISSPSMRGSLYLLEDGIVTNHPTRSDYVLSEEEKKLIQVHKYDDGAFLFVINEKHLCYIEKGWKTFYVSDDYTTTFQGPNSTKVIPTCELLTSALAKLTLKHLELPSPGGNFEAFAGAVDYKGKYSNTTVYLAGVDPLEYANVLKDNGYTVIRSDEDLPFFPYYGERAGSWCIHDQDGELFGHMSFQDYLYIDGTGKDYGPKLNVKISFYKSIVGASYGRARTTDTEWSKSAKESMATWYDGTLNAEIPFCPLMSGYMVPTIMSRASEDLFGGAMMIGQECYRICDNAIDYYLDGYGDVLEAAGYHLYQPSIDISTPAGFRAFENSDESKYYNCYINEAADCAIKFSFSFSDGNCIKVFKKSQMHSHLDDPK